MIGYQLAATSAWILAGVLDKPGNGADWLFTEPGQEYLWLGLPIVLGGVRTTAAPSTGEDR